MRTYSDEEPDKQFAQNTKPINRMFHQCGSQPKLPMPMVDDAVVIIIIYLPSFLLYTDCCNVCIIFLMSLGSCWVSFWSCCCSCAWSCGCNCVECGWWCRERISCWVLTVDCWLQVGCKKLAATWLLVVGCKLVACWLHVGCKLSVRFLLAVGCWLLIASWLQVHCWLLASMDWFIVSRHFYVPAVINKQ